LFFIFALLFAFPITVLANEGEDEHQLEVEINGYHVTLASQNEWVKGENVLVVTITDSMGMSIRDTNVEILIMPQESGHNQSEADTHGSDQQDSTHGMDMGAPATETPVMSDHDEENVSPVAMMESEHGTYTVKTHLDSAGKYDTHVMFHVNGELMQADFVVVVAGVSSKTLVLWSFAAVNVALVATAGVMKKPKTLTVKGA
jgi:hypothetical protein